MRAILLALIVGATLVDAAPPPRSATVVRQFRRLTGCHAVADHRIPICAGGPDTVDNLQCQSPQASYRKDAFERALCRELVRQGYVLVKRP